MTHINQHIGLAHQPTTKRALTITPRAVAATKNSKKPSKAGQNTHSTSYIIYIINNNKTLTHSK